MINNLCYYIDIYAGNNIMRTFQKKTILLDLDGVLNEYKGDYFEYFIPPLRKDARVFLQELYNDFNVVIFTTRNTLLVNKWLEENKLSDYIHGVTNTKIPAFVHIDDRCIEFKGNYKTTIKKIKNFKPYWKTN